MPVVSVNRYWLVLSLLFLSISPLTSAQEVWLMTYGTGDWIEERFGHNALWVRDSGRAIDAIYNFGFFDFEQPNFYQNYVFGRMMYFAVARDPAEELGYYEWRDREVRAQRLNLSAAQIDRLIDWLEVQVSEENREFRYDYYFNNCSNRVRDGLDYALDGWLQRTASAVPAEQNFREHTRRLIQSSPLLYLGIHTGLGRDVDQPRSVWDAMFLPEVVAEQVAQLQVSNADGTQEPFVLEDRLLYESSRPLPPETARTQWLLFASLGLATTLLMVLPVMFFKANAWSLLPFRTWLVLSSLAGAVLLFFWLCTEHEAAWRNENLLLLNPLAILLWRAKHGLLAGASAALLATGLAVAIVLKFFDGAQWNYDLMLWWLPAQLAAVLAWFKAAQIKKCATSKDQ